MGLINLITD